MHFAALADTARWTRECPPIFVEFIVFWLSSETRSAMIPSTRSPVIFGLRPNRTPLGGVTKHL